MDVLVAHREAATRGRLRSLLERAGHQVGEVAALDAVVAACREHDPDVVLLEADAGREPLKAIKSDPDIFAIAVILVGAPEAVGDPSDVLERGAHDVLLTPLRGEEVIARCRAAVKVRHLQEAVLDLDRTLEELAYIDVLTRLYNRRFIFTQLAALTSSALRHGRDLSVIAVDIDRFKRINDTLGHAAGDDVLQAVATRLVKRLRTEDFAARIGGEEFLIVLPDTPGDAAAAVAEDLRRSVSERPVVVGDVTRQVAISLGWAELDRARPDDLLKEADAALYRAKRAGRDQVQGPIGRRPAVPPREDGDAVLPMQQGPRHRGPGRRSRR